MPTTCWKSPIELAMTDEDYADMVLKFLEHDAWIHVLASYIGRRRKLVMKRTASSTTCLRLPTARRKDSKSARWSDCCPLCAATSFEHGLLSKCPEVAERFSGSWKLARVDGRFHDPRKHGPGVVTCLPVLDEAKLRRVLSTMLDENEFLSPFGIRSLSRYHAEHPYVFHVEGQEYRVDYLPGNPIRHVRRQFQLAWPDLDARQRPDYPRLAPLLRPLWQRVHRRMPYGLRTKMTLYQVAEELSRRLTKIFLKDSNGRRPVFGATDKFQNDSHWRDCLLFYEYFHGTWAGPGR